LNQTFLHHSHFSFRLTFKNILVEVWVVRPMNKQTDELVERELRHWEMEKRGLVDASEV
jgi:hypothetical protein